MISKLFAYLPIAMVGVHVQDMLSLFVQILLVRVEAMMHDINNMGAFTNSNSWGLCIKNCSALLTVIGGVHANDMTNLLRQSHSYDMVPIYDITTWLAYYLR